MMKILLVAALDTSIHPPDVQCISQNCPYDNTIIISLGNIPCDSQTYQFWKHWFIYKQESTHIMPLHLFGAPGGTVWTRVWLKERQVSEQGGALGERYTVHHGDSQHTDRPHTWQCSESAAPQLSQHANHISSWFSRLAARNTTGMTPLLTYKYIKDWFGCWMTTNKRKIPQSI